MYVISSGKLGTIDWFLDRDGQRCAIPVARLAEVNQLASSEQWRLEAEWAGFQLILCRLKKT